MRKFLSLVGLVAFAATTPAHAVSIGHGKYLGNFGNSRCGILTIGSKPSYVYGICKGQKMSSVEYRARRVSVSGNLVKIDEATYQVNRSIDGVLIGKWTFQGVIPNLTFSKI